MSTSLFSPMNHCPFRTGQMELSELSRELSCRLLVLRDETISVADLEALLKDPGSVGRARALHITTSCVLYNSDRSAVALLLHRKRKEWFYPGGHPDGSWNWLAGALRECFEETGVSSLSVHFRTTDLFGLPPGEAHQGIGETCLLPQVVVPHPSTGHDHLDFVYAFSCEDRRLTIDPAESLDGRWFELASLLEKGSEDPRLSCETLKVLQAVDEKLRVSAFDQSFLVERSALLPVFDGQDATC